MVRGRDKGFPAVLGDDLDALNIVVVAIGTLVLLIGTISVWVRQSWLSNIMIATATGIALGPAMLGVIDPHNWGNSHHLVEQASRLTLAVGLVGVALRLPQGYLSANRQPALKLLFGGMVLMWIASTLLVWLLLPIGFWTAALLGAIITPTDPVVASSIVTGHVAKKNLPPKIRHLLSFESAANDGLSYLFVFLALLMLTRSPGEALSQWLQQTLLTEVIGGMAFGAMAGWCAARMLRWSEAHRQLEHSSYLAFSVALSMTVLAAAKLIGLNDIFAVFAAGYIFSSSVPAKDRMQEEDVQEAVNRFFVLPFFVLFGAVLPWQGWWEALGWRGLALAVAVLLLRRLPAIALLSRAIQPLHDWPSALFLGWFGPIGVAAIFYAVLAERKLGIEEPWLVCSLIVFGSVITHGVTSSPLAIRYGQVTGYVKQKESH